MLLQYTSCAEGPRAWPWASVLDCLTHVEVAAVARTCRQWSAEVRSLHAAGKAPRTLFLNGHPRCGTLLAAAAAHPSLRLCIRSVSLEFCNALDNFQLTPLGQFPQLTHVNINACRNLTDSAVEIVSENCPRLTRLDLYWLVRLTDISMSALSAAPFPPLLTHLNLSGLKHITDAGLVPLIKQCANLTFLDLTRCEGLRDGSLAAVGASCPRLATLLMYATPHMTDAGFEALAPGVPSLTHLDCTGMKEITDRAIVALSQHCRQMRTLMLMWCSPLTDGSLRAMGAAPLRELRVLSVHGNLHMTAPGMEALAAGCTRIEQLDVNGVRELGRYRNNKAELQTIFPRLQQLTCM